MSSIVYVTGVPGAGKSTMLRELRQRSLEAVGVDEHHIGAFHTPSGRIVEPFDIVDDPRWRRTHQWRIVPHRLDALLDAHHADVIYLCGSAANEGDVWSRFTKVIALTIDNITLRQRLTSRTGNNFGKSEHELSLAAGWNATYAADMASYGATIIDATQPVTAVVNELIAATTTRLTDTS